jgi:acyl carrier protein
MAPSLAEVVAIVRKIVGRPDLKLSAATRFDGLADWNATDLMAVVVELECRHDLQFDLQEIDRLVTIGDLARLSALKQTFALA